MGIGKLIRRWLMRLKAGRDYRRAVAMADEAFAATGQRQYVIRGYKSGRKVLVVTDKRHFKLMKRQNLIKEIYMTYDMARLCYYHTDYLVGGGKMDSDVRKMRRAMCIDWLMS